MLEEAAGIGSAYRAECCAHRFYQHPTTPSFRFLQSTYDLGESFPYWVKPGE